MLARNTNSYLNSKLQIHSLNIIDAKNAVTLLLFFSDKKRVFNSFLFFERFLFSSDHISFILLNVLNSCIKRLLSDGFNMAAVKILSREEP